MSISNGNSNTPDNKGQLPPPRSPGLQRFETQKMFCKAVVAMNNHVSINSYGCRTSYDVGNWTCPVGVSSIREHSHRAVPKELDGIYIEC